MAVFMKKNNKKRKSSKRKPCFFCLEQMEYVDYKNTEILTKFINIHGKILPARVTGTCARHQRELSRAIKRARIMALIPFISERIRR